MNKSTKISISLFFVFVICISQTTIVEETLMGYSDKMGSRFYVLEDIEAGGDVQFVFTQSDSVLYGIKLFLQDKNQFVSFQSTQPLGTFSFTNRSGGIQYLQIYANENYTQWNDNIEGDITIVHRDADTQEVISEIPIYIQPRVGSNAQSGAYLDQTINIAESCPIMISHNLTNQDEITSFVLYSPDQNQGYNEYTFNEANKFTMNVDSYSDYILKYNYDTAALESTRDNQTLSLRFLAISLTCQCTDTNQFWDEEALQCAVSECGDGTMEGNQQCDDGNTESGDGCSTTCLTEQENVCGDGVIDQDTQQCDDGNTEDGDDCPSDCRYHANLGLILPLTIGIPILIAGVIAAIFIFRPQPSQQPSRINRSFYKQ